MKPSTLRRTAAGVALIAFGFGALTLGAAASGPEPLLSEPLPPVESFDRSELSAHVLVMREEFQETQSDMRSQHVEEADDPHIRRRPVEDGPDTVVVWSRAARQIRPELAPTENAWLLEAGQRIVTSDEPDWLALGAVLDMVTAHQTPEGVFELAVATLERGLSLEEPGARQAASALVRLDTPDARAIIEQLVTVRFREEQTVQLGPDGPTVEPARPAYPAGRPFHWEALTHGDLEWLTQLYEEALQEFQDNPEAVAWFEQLLRHADGAKRGWDPWIDPIAGAHFDPTDEEDSNPKSVAAPVTYTHPDVPEEPEPEPWELEASFQHHGSYRPDCGSLLDEGRLSEAQWEQTREVQAPGLTLEERIAILDSILADGAMPGEVHEWAEIHRLSIMRGLMTDIRPFVEEAWAWLNDNPEHPVAITMAETLLERLAGAPEWGLSIPFAERGPYVEAVLDWLYDRHGYFHYHTLRIVADTGARALRRTGAEGFEHARNERMFIRVMLQDYLDSPELQEAHGDMLPPERAAALLERVEERLARMPGG